MIVPAGSTAACRHAQRILAEQGFTVVDHPTPEATHLLLDVPSFEAPGRLRGGGELSRWLEMLPPGITVIGGNLDCSELAGYPVVDLLRDDIWNNHPQIQIVDFDFYDVDAFNRCENENYVLMAVENWRYVHPLLKILPVDWNYTIPFGLLHSPSPSAGVSAFLRAVEKTVKQEC